MKITFFSYEYELRIRDLTYILMLKDISCIQPIVYNHLK
jgi:hypothetical protein